MCTVLPVPCPRSHREIPCSEFSVRPFPLFSEMRERASRPTVNLGSMLCRLVASLCLVVAAHASHCYNYDTCTTCVGNSVGAPCAWCNDGCQMASDVCAGGAVQQAEAEDAAQRCEAGAQPYVPPPGVDFFSEITGAFRTNPAQRNYGVAITDVDGDDSSSPCDWVWGCKSAAEFDQKTAGRHCRGRVYKTRSAKLSASPPAMRTATGLNKYMC